MNVPINNQYMTPGFDQVIKKYMRKYNVGYREAASILGKRKKKTPIIAPKPKKPSQGEFNLGDDDTSYGSGI
tara:strand:- start:1923 stop:2138 length:216 start_codon:yes stop_codon:yes gene_type:complete